MKQFLESYNDRFLLLQSLIKNKSQNIFIKIYSEIALYLRIYKHVLTTPISNKMILSKIINYIKVYGINAVITVIIIGTFLGAAIACQFYYLLKPVGAQSLTGLAIVKGMICDFGPVMVATLVAGHAGSSMCSEIGNMKISEQTNALKTMGIDPEKYLASPNIISIIIYLPILTCIHALFGMISGRIISTYVFHVSGSSYDKWSFMFIKFQDILLGLIAKPLMFGIIISSIACKNGFSVSNGTSDISYKSSKTVAESIVMIIFANFVLVEVFARLGSILEDFT
ncbi:MAG: ABC transporter permease [Chlamydiia bacterium]|nr:ABC transporter permease [Chlamydiia bacterium]